MAHSAFFSGKFQEISGIFRNFQSFSELFKKKLRVGMTRNGPSENSADTSTEIHHFTNPLFYR